MLQLSTTANIFSNLGYDRFSETNVEGKSGGEILGWNKAINCSILEVSNNWIHAESISIQRVPFMFTCLYGYPGVSEGVRLWEFLRQKCSTLNGASEFKTFMDSTTLIDLHGQGN
ncbi:endonuclease/exonuclease/phosphatase family protein [Senna tora]|uniref:Endonuclease/exonuclease/phosphatase family protein n=1 Tax=Senna tora TaxID=362788 RepID=A0A834WMP8_9FABA|nr:endonuclease/exonuclease/phosphatase family protein [Senna tora]